MERWITHRQVKTVCGVYDSFEDRTWVLLKTQFDQLFQLWVGLHDHQGLLCDGYNLRAPEWVGTGNLRGSASWGFGNNVPIVLCSGTKRLCYR